jgi:hypothetical protein
MQAIFLFRIYKTNWKKKTKNKKQTNLKGCSKNKLNQKVV